MSESHTHRVTRTILASPRAIYRAFLDAESVASWRPTSGMTARVERFEPWIGGSYRMAFIYPEASPENGKGGSGEDIFEGNFVDLLPDERIVEAVTFETDDPDFAGTMTITTRIEREKGNSSKVTVLAENVPTGISEADHREGMSSSLRNLANLLE